MRIEEQSSQLVRNTPKWLNNPDDWFDPKNVESYRYSFSGGERDHLFLSGHAEKFTDVAGIAGVDSPSDGRGFAHWDYDRDGWPDLAVVNANSPPLQLHQNQLGVAGSGRPHVIALRFVGGNGQPEPSDWSTRDGIGAQAIVSMGEHRLLREHRCGEGFAAQNSATMLVGLGDVEQVDTVEIRWPSGRRQSVSQVPAGTLLTCFENPAQSPDGTGFLQSDYFTPHKPSPDPSTVAAENSAPLPESLGFSPASLAGQSAPPQLQMVTTTATWCESCVRHLPRVAQLRQSFDPQTLGMYGAPVDPDDTAEMLAQYVAGKQPAYQMLPRLSEEQLASLQGLLRQRLKTDALPMTLIVDQAGRVLLIAPGLPTVSDIHRLLDNVH